MSKDRKAGLSCGEEPEPRVQPGCSAIRLDVVRGNDRRQQVEFLVRNAFLFRDQRGSTQLSNGRIIFQRLVFLNDVS